MTNSRLTDPEVLEWRYPVLLEECSVRADSGGQGRMRGGNGATRKLRFLEPMTAAILANRRRLPPFGLEGGESASPGVNYVLRKDGSRVDLAATGSAEMQPGRSEEHTSELQSRFDLVCRLLLEKKNH